MVIDHNFYMSLAIQEAWKQQGLTYPNPAVGALILDKNNNLLSIEATQEAGYEHAELKAIEKALISLGDKILEGLQTPSEKHSYICQNYQDKLKDATIYVTLEPCTHHGKTPPCSTLIKTCGFKTIVCGMVDPNDEATGGMKMLKNSGIEVITSILSHECNELLTPFKKWQKNKPYIFFKLAITKNGVYDGGTISSVSSRTLVHKLREKIDLLVIGGNTVRTDRPTLDARLSGGKAPDVLIYSKRDDFDKDIPLFLVKGRNVFIKNRLDMVKDYNFVMIEGTEAMMKETKDIVDHYMIFTSSDFKVGKTIQFDLKLKNLYKSKNETDSIEWFKKI